MGFIKKSQTWSIDILVAVFIFVAIFIMFTGIMASMSKSEQKQALSEKGQKITKILSTDSPISFIEGNKINDSKLKQIVGDYDALKTEFDYDKFCIYLEDENGNLIPIKTDAGDTYNGIGSLNATVNGVKCGQKVE